jgi:hypothetical protein
MSFLGFYAIPYRTGKPLDKEQKQELEYRIHILEDLVPHDLMYKSMQNLVPQAQSLGDLPRVIYYNYLVASANANCKDKEAEGPTHGGKG